MGRLTFKEPDGTWGVVGVNADDQDTKVYACLAKLKDYEETGMMPGDVDIIANHLEDALEHLDTAPQKTGLHLKQALHLLIRGREG